MRLNQTCFRAGRCPVRDRAVRCRMGGPSFGGDANKPPGRLIIPGQENSSPPSRPGSLLIPGSPGAPPGIITASDTPAFRNFRPPPGFMDSASSSAPSSAETSASTDEMLNRLQAQAGKWHQLAKLLPILASKGIDAFTVEETSGLERKTQNLWTSAASIYDSLKRDGHVEPEVLAQFDMSGSEVLLHELRFLSGKQRAAAVDYIARNALEHAECKVLARAIKEHERRAGAREGFSDSPADCLAYKYYRDALECRSEETAEKYAKKGLAIVETEAGREKLASVAGDIGTAVAPASDSPQAMLNVLRLTKEEVGCRPIAVAGSLADVSADAVRSAPKVASEGAFAAFTIPEGAGSWRWVPLPAWSVVSLAGRPVAFSIPNCADLPSLRSSSGAKSDDEYRKLMGPGMLVIDTEPGVRGPLEPKSYYLVDSDTGGVELVGGGDISDESKILGPVLFLCRPPTRDVMGSTTAELLSV